MNKFIEVYDNLFPYIANELEYFVIESQVIDWKFSSNVSGVKGQKVIGFANVFYSNINNKPYSTNIFPTLSQPLFSMCSLKNIRLDNIYYSRTFLQPPSPSPQTHLSAIHTDLTHPHWVCLYYVNDSDGDTVFFDDNNNEIKRVSPKKGRIAFFDGSIRHTASSPSSIRAIINVCFSGKKLG